MDSPALKARGAAPAPGIRARPGPTPPRQPPRAPSSAAPGGTRQPGTREARQWDTALYTLDLAQDAASTALDSAAVAKTRVWLQLRQGDLAAARDTAIRWADDIEPRFSRATCPELSLWGDLQTTIANAAIRDNRPGEAADALRLARAAADLLGREMMTDPSTSRMFGPATVRVRVTELDGPSGVLVEVCDASPEMPCPVTAGPDSLGGRGLAIVAAVAARHGADRDGPGKRVWAEITPGAGSPAPLPAPRQEDAGRLHDLPSLAGHAR